MAWKSTLVLVLTFLTIGASEAWAQKFEIAPFVGYRTGGSFTVEGEEAQKIGLEAGPAIGFTAGVGLNESWQIEFLWSRAASEISQREPGFGSPGQRIFDSEVDQFHVNLLWQYGLAQDRFRPFLFGGLGATHFGAEEGFSSETRFSLGFGGGIKYFFANAVGIRLQGRVIPSLMQADSDIFCTRFYCYRVWEDEYLVQGELNVALVFRIQ